MMLRAGLGTADMEYPLVDVQNALDLGKERERLSDVRITAGPYEFMARWERAKSSKDLVETWLVLLGHTPWHVAAGHLAPLEGFRTSAILTAWCRLWSAGHGSVARRAGCFWTHASVIAPPS
jgi:hypothetical protein